MGKRKKSSRKPQGPRKKESLPTQFQCLFCNHETSVSVKVDKRMGVANLICKVCAQKYNTTAHRLTEPVDVYSEWIDACDTVAKEEEEAAPAGPRRSTATGSVLPPGVQQSVEGTGAQGAAKDGYAADGDDFVVPDEDEDEKGYGNDED